VLQLAPKTVEKDDIELHQERHPETNLYAQPYAHVRRGDESHHTIETSGRKGVEDGLGSTHVAR
jgi:hypothetical protein